MDLLHLLVVLRHQRLGLGGQILVELLGGGLLIRGEVQSLGQEPRRGAASSGPAGWGRRLPSH